MTHQANDLSGGCGKRCACHAHLLNRRDFLTLTAATTLAGMLPLSPVMAGPFETSDFARLVPPDKKLRLEWVKSLFARGEQTTYSKKRDELRFIGMPVGGICCGTVYLGGDGRLWVWDIFNEVHEGLMPGDTGASGGSSYITPHQERSPLEQGFALRIGDTIRRFDTAGWEDITFEGQYPIGRVRYSDPASPISAVLTAYSPFIPLNADDSGLPITLCEFTLENLTDKPVKAEIGGWLQNASRLSTGLVVPGNRVNTVHKAAGVTLLEMGFRSEMSAPAALRPDIVVEDFQHEGYGQWKAEGTAFGAGPILRKDVPAYQGDLGGTGERVVNSHAAAPGNTVEEKDAATGTLTSPPFTLARNYLSFDIGGGSDVAHVGLALIVDGQTVRRAAGKNSNHIERTVFNVVEFAGKQATIQVYDHATGGWGNIGVGDIVQTDTPRDKADSPKDRDNGTMALALLGTATGKAAITPDTLFSESASASARKAPSDLLIGGITKSLRLLPGKPQTVVFAVAWHFPHSPLGVSDASTGNYYGRRFPGASAVAEYAVKEYGRLSQTTKLWNRTWYDSTLPYWFLDRTFVNTSTLATATFHRFGTGRYWGWEGVGCCEGTCTHVYHYAQAIGRVFPEIERDLRERVDFGVAFDKSSGQIGYRGEGTGPAVDGQCGRILGVYREHQMSASDTFLRRLWPRVKMALDWVSRYDTDGDGLLEGAQDNTLDAAWYGKIAWINSLYAAALRAGQAMALNIGDSDYAVQCEQKLAQTRSALETKLFNGEYFIQLPEAGHEHSLGVYQTSHIDQVQGQSWAWQVGLGRILDREKTLSALKALYCYNFAPDVGPFRAKNTSGRPYALAGDGGLIMATNPRELPDPFGEIGWQTGYFNECMSGFEHQAASHMIAEGMLLEGMVVTRAIHDRYHASRRNPYNEIECSDHYARAMASYGSFISICGFEYHGPQGHLAFAPRITPENFRAPFIVAEGWGSYSQKQNKGRFTAQIEMKAGRLALRTLALTPLSLASKSVNVTLGGLPLNVISQMTDGKVIVTLPVNTLLEPGKTITVVII